MKNLCNFLFLIIIMSPAVSFSADQKRIPANSKITAVTVYPDLALTRRSSTFSLKPGSYLITFDALPALILDESVRIEGLGSAVATISGLEIKRAFLERSGENRVQELQNEINSLEQRSASLDARKSGITAQKSFIESIRVAWGDRISKELAIGRPSAAELKEVSGFVGSEITKAEGQSREIEFEKKSIKDKIDALKRQQNEAAGSNRKESKSAEIAVEITREGSLTLELVSLTPQASWEPSYDVRLADDVKSAELTFMAMVRQQTGEEWPDIELTLSTARPSIGSNPPELYPWNISLYRPRPMISEMGYPAAAAPIARTSKSTMAQADLMSLEAAREEDAPASFQSAQISEEQSSVTFRIPRTLSIHADGSRHATVVAKDQLPVSIEYLTIPKLAPTVFLRSGIVNQAPYPLLPGKISTFVGNSYTGSSQLRRVASGEKFELYFGSDDQMTVKRDEVKQHKEAGLFGKNVANYRYRIEVGNFRKEALTLTLQDQLPVAGDEEIKVSLDTPSVKPDEVKNDGTLTWKLPLKAGEKRTVEFGIAVEYPKERTITGL